jgi:hypothetical protein
VAEHRLPKPGVEGSNPFSRSIIISRAQRAYNPCTRQGAPLLFRERSEHTIRLSERTLIVLGEETIHEQAYCYVNQTQPEQGRR